VSKKLVVATTAPVYMREWWDKKISSGLVSTHVHTWRYGVEYLGNLPWPNMVSLQALYEDFCYEYGDKIQLPKGSFYHYFRKTVIVPNKETKRVRHKIEDITIKLTGLVFVEIPRV